MMRHIPMLFLLLTRCSLVVQWPDMIETVKTEMSHNETVSIMLSGYISELGPWTRPSGQFQQYEYERLKYSQMASECRPLIGSGWRPVSARR